MSEQDPGVELEQLSYEELYRRLEQTAQQLESGDLPLEQALACYERGMQLTAACQRLLEQAELRIQRVSSAADGSLQLEPWSE